MGRPRTITPEQESRVADAYVKGQSGTSLAKELGFSPHTIYAVLKRRAIPRRGFKGRLEPVSCACGCGAMVMPYMNNKTGKRYAYKIGHWAKAHQKALLDEQELEAVRLYSEDKLKISEIQTVLQVGKGPIERALAKHDVSRRTRSQELTKYSENSRYFHHIDDPNKAYWVGFIAADGCVITNRLVNRLIITLHVRDHDHVVKFKYAIESDRPVKLYEPDKGCPRAVIDVHNAAMNTDLAQWGIVPRKSNILTFPENLPAQFYRDYIRGYVDGDGCITSWNGGLNFDLCGTQAMMQRIQEILISACHLRQTKIYIYKGTNLYRFSYGGNLQVPRILYYLYHGAETYLDRKAKYFFDLQSSQLLLGLELQSPTSTIVAEDAV